MSKAINTLNAFAEGELVGTAFYRIDPKLREFLTKCQEKHEIIGIEWDGESLNFGFILVEPTPTGGADE